MHPLIRLTKYLILFCFIGFVSALVPKSSYGAEFTFDYKVTYKVQESGVTDVINEITITNLLSGYYAQNYMLTMNSERIDRVRALDAHGNLNPEVRIEDGQTAINVPFITKTVGLNESYTFTLSYQSRDVAVKKGRIWEIIIPGLENKEEIHTYQVKLEVPRTFGTAAYISPPPGEDGFWHMDTLTKKGITAAYGDIQVFGFNLIYHLTNMSGDAEYQEITLPPDTAFQQMLLWRLSEKAENVEVDRDGNWLARYKLEANEEKKIVAEGNVLVYISPREGFVTTLSEEEKKLYTQEQEHWEVTDEMKRKASELKNARAIYDYVVDTLSYDYSRVKAGVSRLGASEIFAHPERAVCMEFSDLFVAMARSIDIPAREIHGYAYTNNSRLQPLSLVTDVLHAWVEYYDEERMLWIPIDPTWGNTTRGVDYFSKLDFNHITFAILGKKSNYPYPAGSFRKGTTGKDVFVEFAEELPQIPTVEVEATVHLPEYLKAGTIGKGSLEISNPGPTLLMLDRIETLGEFKAQISYESAIIPPNGHSRVAFTLMVPWSLMPKTSQVEFLVQGTRITHPVKIIPLYMTLPFLGGVGILVLVALGVGIYATRRRTTK